MAKTIENNTELAKMQVRAKEFYDLAVYRYIEKHARDVDFLEDYLDEKEKREYDDLQRRINDAVVKS